MRLIKLLIGALCLFPMLISAQDKCDNRALHFDGIDDYVDLGNTLPNGGFRTMEMYFKLDFPINPTENNTLFMPLMMRNTNGVQESCEVGFVFNTHQDGYLSFFTSDPNGNLIGYAIFSDSNNWLPNKWYHVAGVIDPNLGMKMYVDGVLQADTDSHTNTTCYNSAPMSIGRWGDLSIRYFTGTIDEVRFWSTARSEQEIQSNMNVALPGNEQGLMTYYNFNQGIGNGNNPNETVLLDRTNGNINGTLHNFNLFGPTSNWVCSPITALESYVAENIRLSVFPNPLENTLYISSEFALAENATFSILGVTDGKKYLNGTLQKSETISLDALPAGLYCLKVINGGKVYTAMFSKI